MTKPEIRSGLLRHGACITPCYWKGYLPFNLYNHVLQTNASSGCSAPHESLPVLVFSYQTVSVTLNMITMRNLAASISL